MTNLASLLTDSAEYSEMVKEDVTQLLCDAGIWDDVADWEYVEEDRSLVVTLAPRSTPDFTHEQLKPLGEAGFDYLHVRGFGPLSSFCLIQPKAES